MQNYAKCPAGSGYYLDPSLTYFVVVLNLIYFSVFALFAGGALLELKIKLNFVNERMKMENFW